MSYFDIIVTFMTIYIVVIFMATVNNITILYNFLMISYQPFWNTLKSKGVSTYALISKYNISSATIDRLRKGGGISTTKINDLCKILNCTVADIIEFVPENNE